MAPYEVLYGRRYRTTSCWTELGERRVLGPKLISDTEDKVRLIWGQLKEASNRQKSYTDLKRKGIEYSVGDLVFLKTRHGRRRYHSNPTHIISTEEIEVSPDLTFEEEPIQILDCDVKVLRRKSILLVKVLWHNHRSEEAIWEPKETMQYQYPHLF
ncbi:uncharacterized protein [Gossypium hirsutum]|uniref:DNA/RNA polymerases superfamily protein n=1 Tax=Gossypium hirsutum TaxID=3635 RepID=A0A1U8PPP9_GOSHI|nr:uncharacterized protein LOC107960384 [Gossypium hirsutum]